MTIEEDFELERAVPVSLSLMTTRLATVNAGGTITMKALVSGKACLMKFDATQMEPVVEKKDLVDERLRNDLGDSVWRILLKTTETGAKGKWSYDFGPT